MNEVPNLVATKNSTGDYYRIADLMKHAGELQHFLLEGGFAMGCMLGECSLLCSYDALFPKTYWEFFEADRKGDLANLWRLHVLINDVDFFSELPRSMIDGSYDKILLWLSNPKFPTRMLPPYIGLSADELAACRRKYEAQYAHIR